MNFFNLPLSDHIHSYYELLIYGQETMVRLEIREQRRQVVLPREKIREFMIAKELLVKGVDILSRITVVKYMLK